jgi:dTMP kinase
MSQYIAPFITLEGIDGAGKSSHMTSIRAALASAGFKVLETREPGGTELGSRLRSELKHTPMAPDTQLLIAFADRAEHLAQKILPALSDGTAVVSDRFTDSTFAYQGGGADVNWEKILLMEKAVQSGFGPDLTLFFDLPTEIAAARRDGRTAAAPAEQSDIFDEKHAAWFQKVRDAYQRRLNEEPGRFLVINAAATLDDVAAEVTAGLTKFLQGWPKVVAARKARADPPSQPRPNAPKP